MNPRMRQPLRESRVVRTYTVGLKDAISDLGTHRVCGVATHYSTVQVQQVLKGRSGSRPLLRRIVERRPDLLDLSYVPQTLRERARSLGWTTREERRAAGLPTAMSANDGLRGAEPAKQETEGMR